MRLNKAILLNSLALRILLAYIAGAVLSICLLLAFGAIVQDRLPGMSLSDSTLALAKQIKFDSDGTPTGLQSETGKPLWIFDSMGQEFAYRLLDESGNIVLMSRGAQSWPDMNDIFQRKLPRFAFTLNGVLYSGATESIRHNGKTWFLQLSASSRAVDFLHQQFAVPYIRGGILIFGLVLLFIFGICAYVSLKCALSPLRKVSLAAASISAQSLNERLQSDRVPTEIRPLIDSFNQVLDRLEQGFRTQQDFLAKAAHELKTPLTLIRAEVELMQDVTEARTPLLTQVAHLARHVQQLLLLSEASELLSYQLTQVDAYGVAHDAAVFLQKTAEDARVAITISSTQENIVWRADQGALFTLLKNLIENAVQHAPPDTLIEIEIGANYLSVRDQGPGVEPAHLPLLFLRFWRGAHRRDHGAGLGLAICREIARAHGWTLSARNISPGLVLTVMHDFQVDD